MEFEIPGVIWRAVPALKLHVVKYSEEGLYFLRLFVGCHQKQGEV